MDIKSFFYDNDGSINLILGQSHFIKTVSDLAEIIACTVPNAKFAVAFCEASGPCLIRYESNDKDLEEKAINFMKNIKAGHTFVIMLKDCYPINILSKIKMCDEVCRIYCATANPLTVLTVDNDNGAGIIGVIDGFSPKGVETEEDKTKRKEFLKKIGYSF
ncbi:MAG TPA: adenosine-specific kinase [Spirochaetota bacterium]|nr:adenosine-specific kinase [Spirochaetota bacterium]HOL56100.1 adenosine-specific kinase [Spirochaetota bacterium]HPP03486.1 adenosine-specific kinase [Spirochaetota bacterium]